MVTELKTIKIHQHCNLCEHIDARLSEGIFCSLNGKRPSFKTSCPTFKLNENTQHKLMELKGELNRIEIRIKKFKTNFFLLILIGAMNTLYGYYFFENNHKSIYYTKYALGFCAFGLLLWSTALQKRTQLLRKRNRIENRIEEFEQVLSRYS